MTVLSQLPLSRPEVARGLDALRRRLSRTGEPLTTAVADLGPETILHALTLGSPRQTQILVVIGADRAVDCAPKPMPPALVVYAVSVGGRLPHGGCFASLGARIWTPLDADALTQALTEIADELGKTPKGRP